MPLKEGDEDAQVIILKERLILAGFYELEEEQELDAQFDEQLRDAVTEFQSLHELETTGEYDESTQNLLADYLENELNTLYSIDDESEEIADLKMTLSFIGYGNFPEEPSPYFGQLTKQIVEEFQETEELEVTGAINEETLEVLMSLVEKYDVEHIVGKELGKSESTDEEAVEEDTVIEEKPGEKETDEKEIDKSPDTEDSKESIEEDKEQSSESDARKEENSVKDEEDAEQKEEAAEEKSNETEESDTAGESKDVSEEETEEIDESDPAADENQDASEETTEEAEKSEEESLESESDKDGEKREEKDLEDSEETDSSAFSMSLMTVEEPLALPYEDGDSGDDIVTLKQDLTRLGFGNFPSSPSNRYGPVTMGVVEEFQKYYGLNATGITDEETYDRIAAELNTIYRDGQADEDIVELKKKLTVLGYGNFPSSPSNRYGPVTEGVVKEFQYSENLRVNGIGDSVTVALLEERYLEEWYATANLTLPYENGDSGDDIVTLKQDLTRLGFGNFPSSPSNRYGPVTMGVVKDFQEYYGLSATGETDQATYDRIAAELNTIYRDGQAHTDIVSFKQDLTRLGYGNFPAEPSNRYGPVTEGVVLEFQKAEELVENGIGDSITIERLKERTTEYHNANLSLPFENGDVGDLIRELKIDLTRLGFGNFPSSPSNRYGPVTMGVVEDFQKYYGLRANGRTDQRTLDRLKQELNTIYRDGQAHDDIKTFKQNLTQLGYGNFPSSPSNRYGSVTSGVVSEFQESQDLVVNGIGDSVTLAKIESLLPDLGNGVVTASNLNVRQGPGTGYGIIGTLPNGTEVNLLEDTGQWYRISHSSITASPAYVSKTFIREVSGGLPAPYQAGDAGDEIVELKKNLTKLGFGNFPSSPSNRYGSVTEGVVKVFQGYFGLSVTGKADRATLDYIDEVLDSSYQEGKRHEGVRDLKLNLTRLGFGNFPSSPSNSYGSVTAGVVREFQAHHQLVVNGIGDSVTLMKINSELDKQGGTGHVRSYNMTIEQMLDRQMNLGPQTDLYGGGWKNAKREDVKRYLDPSNLSLDPSSRDMYQFLKLSQTSGVSAAQLNNILNGRGILHNTGATFKNAAERNGVNDIYLIAHALLETGHGTSILSNGSIEVGQISTNKWVSIRPTSNGKATYILERVYNDRNNRWSWVRTRNDNFNTNGITLRKTYNMFGIEAVDSDPYTRGSVRAFREGWFTPEASIRGGAQFISSSYLGRGQDTLYKMRWDPDFHEAAVNRSTTSFGRSSAFQYATDIGWAHKQTSMIKRLYDQIENPYLPLEVPEYKR
nr:peptidoglycan-binding protein [Salipaludibacillus sp. CUR1]